MAATILATSRPADSASRIGGRALLVWGGCVLLLVAAPLVFDSNASVSLLSRLGALIVFCLSYNVLLGQGGMLSFGHAVYAGLGGYFAVHAMNDAAAGGWMIPLPLIPLVGGLGGALFGALLGYPTTKKAGTTFAMITLGVGELLHAVAQMLPTFFGGEGGITTNRTYGPSFLGLTFGPQIQVYGLICVWLLVSTAAIYAFTLTPLGRIANAVRDNPERAEYIGYDTRRVRWLVLIVATFFAGVSGALAVINSEVVSSEALSAARSGEPLLFTFMGGIGSFAGPIVGAVVGGFLSIKLSDYTGAWQFYLGAAFILFVMYAPSGIAGIVGAHARLLGAGRFGVVLKPWLAVAGGTVAALVGLVLLTELSYSVAFAEPTTLAKRLAPLGRGGWILGTALLGGGLLLLRSQRPNLRAAWELAEADDAELLPR